MRVYQGACRANDRTDGCGVYKYNHVHELTGSTMFAETGTARHNHRFSAVSGPARSRGGSHVHEVALHTDFAGHFHEVTGVTGPAVSVSAGRHVHYFEAKTALSDGHTHQLVCATLIAGPACT